MKRETELWLDRAEYDLETAGAMLKAARYLYVAFACQQTIEKFLKAIIQEKTNQHPPYSHNLIVLHELAEAKLSQQLCDFLVILSQYYLNTRYTDFKQKLSADINQQKAQDVLNKTLEVVACLKKKLPT